MPSVSIYRPPAARKLEQNAALSSIPPRDMVSTPSPEKNKLKCSEEAKELSQTGRRSESNGMSVFRNAITSIRAQNKLPECKNVETASKKIENESKVGKTEEVASKSNVQNRQRRPDIQVYVPKGRRSTVKAINSDPKTSVSSPEEDKSYKSSDAVVRGEENGLRSNSSESEKKPSKVDSESLEISNSAVTSKDNQTVKSSAGTDAKVNTNSVANVESPDARKVNGGGEGGGGVGGGGVDSSEEKISENRNGGKAITGSLNPEECDWESMFDDSGECLDPSLLEQLTCAVGEVTIEKPKSSYDGYKPKSLDVVADEFPHVIEIYNFPPEFQIQDLMAVFSQFKNSGFEIVWVDETHALGIFSSSAIVSQVLSFYHPFVKTRSLKEGTPLSKMKARKSAEFLQPYKQRPRTCPALARRLVTGALGVKLPTSREEREAEKKILTKAREKKRLEAKQKEDAWEGTFS